MSKIKFLMVLCIIGFAEIANAQQQVSVVEAITAAINTLYNKEDVLKISANTKHSFTNNKSNILTFKNKERRKV